MGPGAFSGCGRHQAHCKPKRVFILFTQGVCHGLMALYAKFFHVQSCLLCYPVMMMKGLRGHNSGCRLVSVLREAAAGQRAGGRLMECRLLLMRHVVHPAPASAPAAS